MPSLRQALRRVAEHLESVGADLNGTSPAAIAQRNKCHETTAELQAQIADLEHQANTLAAALIHALTDQPNRERNSQGDQ